MAPRVLTVSGAPPGAWHEAMVGAGVVARAVVLVGGPMPTLVGVPGGEVRSIVPGDVSSAVREMLLVGALDDSDRAGVRSAGPA